VDDLLYRAYYIDDLTLNDWNMMPVLWLWTWTLDNQQAESAVYEALKVWYRLIDTARYYENEEWVWRGIKRAIDEWLVKREDVFVTTKVIPSNYSNPDNEVDISLKNLGLDYIDLMLIHQPWANDNGLYHAFERAVEEWKVRSIGISNYYTPQAFDSIYSIAKIKPAVLQNENHIFYQNTKLKEYIKKYWTVLESWYPLGGRWHTDEVFSNETIKKLAEKYEKTSAQIVLRWQIQDGNIAIPWSSDPEHIKENYNIFDFELTSQEMKLIHMINKNQRYENR
jgi:diketogulonate reductase-like aldo/keto reductase